MKKSRIVRDLCGNEYLVEEAHDLSGSFLEVYEVFDVDGVRSQSYLFDVDVPLHSQESDILDAIDDMREQLND